MSANSLSEAHLAIQGRLATHWGFTPIQYPGVQGLVDGAQIAMLPEPPTNNPWIRLDFVDGASTRASIGGNYMGCFRRAGIAQVAVFVPMQEGANRLNELKEYVLTIFEGEMFSGVSCQRATLGPDRVEGGWLNGVVTVDFEYTRSKTSSLSA